MAIHLTGAISFQDLINEFNVPKPVSLSQMYTGAANGGAGGAAVVGNSLINWVSVGTINGSRLN